MSNVLDQLSEYAREKSKPKKDYDPDDLEFDDDDEESSNWEEDDEGNVITYDEEDEEQEDVGFDGNLASLLSHGERLELGQKLLDLIDIDKSDREPHDKKYAEGIARSGLSESDGTGAPFDGASTVTHPILTECAVDFESAAMKEIHPPAGPVKIHIMGQMTPDKRQKAERKRDFMNWQLTDQIEEYPTELESLLIQLPFSGAQYLSWFQDDNLGRPSVELITSDRVYLPYGATNFYMSSRVSIATNYTESEIEAKIEAGTWIDIENISNSQLPERSKTQEQQDRVEGVEDSGYNEDGIKLFYRVFLWHRLDKDKEGDGKSVPYIMIIDSETGEIPFIRRNWEKKDDLKRKLDHVVEFKFFPWKGPYGIGFTHMIGGLASTMTGSLRALLDTAHINNFPALLKMKSKAGGQSLTLEATGVTEIEGTSPVDDIRKLIMPVPYNPPSEVLFKLLGWLDGVAKGVVTTAEEKIADASNNGPVGTTLALIEQGSKVYANIHARLHRSVKKCLQILHRINRDNLNDKVTVEELGDLVVYRKDFEGPMDLIPVSDPHIFSESQRYAQLQAVRQLRTQEPDLFNRKALVRRELQQLRVDNYEELLVPDPQQIKANPVAENIMMAKGRPASAFPEQDHLAHIKVLISFMQDPNLGGSPLIAPKYMPLAMEHLGEHIVLWYGMFIYDTMGKMVGPEFEQYLKMDQLSPKIDKVLGLIAEEVHDKMGITMQGVPAVIQQAQQLLAQFQQPRDPNVMEVQRKSKRDQMDFANKGQKLQLDDKKAGLRHQTDLLRTKVSAMETKQKDTEIDKKTATDIIKAHRSNQTAIAVAEIGAKSKEDVAQANADTKRVMDGKDDDPVKAYAQGGHVKSDQPSNIHIDLSSVVDALKSQMPSVDLAPIIKALESHNSNMSELHNAVKLQPHPPAVDLSPVVDAIKSQPQPPPTDLSPVVDAIRGLHNTHKSDLAAMKDRLNNVESNKQDLTPLMQAISGHSAAVKNAVGDLHNKMADLKDHVSDTFSNMKDVTPPQPAPPDKKPAKVKIKRDKDNNIVGRVTKGGKSVRIEMKRDEDNNLVGDIKPDDD